MMDLIARAQATLRANDRGGYTVPTARLYPFQWNWDSAFVAIGFATFDSARAWEEIDKLLLGQWDDGMIPQIVFHAPSDDYFPGPAVWGVAHTPPTSGITQPPVLATAARAVLAADTRRRGADGGGVSEAARQSSLVAARPRPRRHRARDDTAPLGNGDGQFARVGCCRWHVCPTDTTTVIVGATRRMSIRRCVRAARSTSASSIWSTCSAMPAGIPRANTRASPFRVADIATNSDIAAGRARSSRFGRTFRHGMRSAPRSPAGSTPVRAAIARLWDGARGLFVGWDQIADAPLAVSTSAGFLPLYAGP